MKEHTLDLDIFRKFKDFVDKTQLQMSKLDHHRWRACNGGPFRWIHCQMQGGGRISQLP